jgi:hypothetical protein
MKTCLNWHCQVNVPPAVIKGGYTIVTLPRIVTPYRDNVGGTRGRVTYRKVGYAVTLRACSVRCRVYRTKQHGYPRQKEMFRTGRNACLLFKEVYKINFTAKNAWVDATVVHPHVLLVCPIYKGRFITHLTYLKCLCLLYFITGINIRNINDKQQCSDEPFRFETASLKEYYLEWM